MYVNYKFRKESIFMKKNDSNKSEKSFSSSSINWYPGHMAKTRREIKEKIDLIDIVFEVIDARMPISSKIVDIDDLIKDKPRVLVMTKYDLCDKVETDKIAKYYEVLGYKVVCVDLMALMAGLISVSLLSICSKAIRLLSLTCSTTVAAGLKYSVHPTIRPKIT